MVELGTVEHAGEGLGRRGVGLGREAVVARHDRRSCFWMLLAGAVNRRLFRETLVGQEVGLDRVLSGGELGCQETHRQSVRVSRWFDTRGREKRRACVGIQSYLPLRVLAVWLAAVKASPVEWAHIFSPPE